MLGYFSLVLHTHQPYVRKNGVFPVGEDWLYQVMADTYLPLLEMLAQLQHEGLTSCLAVTMTPVLCEQLADPYVKERFIEYLEVMAGHAGSDTRDFEYFSDEKRKALGEAYRDDFRRKRLAYLAIDGDLLGALGAFEEGGLIEVISSSATHAFLPGFTDPRSVERQVRLGIDSHRAHFGRDPAGFWIPECAYRVGLEDLLESEGVGYMLIDGTALPDGLPSTYAYLAGSSHVNAIARSERAHTNVWDELAGYPTDGAYIDSTKYYHSSGLYYWRVTGLDVPIEDKEVYEPEAAQRRALDHASHFIGEVTDELGSSPPPATETSGNATPMPIVLASYDTELFGHFWREGPYWLEVTLRSLARCEGLAITTPSLYLAGNAGAAGASLKETTWGTNRDHSTWLNGSTTWIWDELGRAQNKLFELSSLRGQGEHYDRALAQAVREILLLESSDWPYMVAKDRAKGYSIERFKAHSERFSRITGALERGEPEQLGPELSEIEESDNIFKQIDLDTIFGSGDPPGRRR
ncbi:MAG TPA: 1,4-alpha-glucan branching protein domain-containing protein [Candidatus Anoxymicrobiaceae bacterium]